MKKALQLLNSFKYGGAENVALNYSIILKKLEISSIFCAKNNSEKYINNLIENHFLYEENISNHLISQVDYIFIHSNLNLLKLLKYKILGKLKGKKVFYIQHLHYSEKKFVMLSLLINYICTDFIQITPITSKLVSKYIRIKKHFIINFYITKYKKESWKEIRNLIRKKEGILQDRIVVTFSAVFKPMKNLKNFIELADSMKNNSNYIFLLIGDGEQSSLIKEYKGGNIIWKGFVNDVEKYLIASDIYCFMSKKEMMPMALIEAINTERKIIAYKTDLNDFMLDNNTFEKITSDTLINIDSYIKEEYLTKYDQLYALNKLQKLFDEI
ncbi:MAG: glycosyltransferase [Capnocytophaga sp.]|uniref:glycosyltransferase n=1 Tax=Capnocytophaga sp. TaxID=44737 RepID=UPI003FA08400